MYSYENGVTDNEFCIVVDKEQDEQVTIDELLDCLWNSIDFTLDEPEDGYGTPVYLGNDHVAFALIIDAIDFYYTGYVDFSDLLKLNENGTLTLTLYKEEQ